MLGALFGLGGIAVAIGMLIEPRIYSKKTIGLQLLALALISGACLIVLANLRSPWALLIILIPALAFGMIQIASNTVINQMATSDKRATILSVEGMALKVAYGVFAVLTGLLLDNYSINVVLMVAALTTIIGSGLCAILLMRFHDKNHIL